MSVTYPTDIVLYHKCGCLVRSWNPYGYEVVTFMCMSIICVDANDVPQWWPTEDIDARSVGIDAFMCG